jgi:hypothetical protein
MAAKPPTDKGGKKMAKYFRVVEIDADEFISETGMDCIATSKSRITDEEWQRLCDGYKAITGEEYRI